MVPGSLRTNCSRGVCPSAVGAHIAKLAWSCSIKIMIMLSGYASTVDWTGGRLDGNAARRSCGMGVFRYLTCATVQTGNEVLHKGYTIRIRVSQHAGKIVRDAPASGRKLCSAIWIIRALNLIAVALRKAYVIDGRRFCTCNIFLVTTAIFFIEAASLQLKKLC